MEDIRQGIMPLHEHAEKSAAARGLNIERIYAEAKMKPHEVRALKETGKLDLGRIIRIADLIGCTVDELIGRTPPPNNKRPVGEALTEAGLTASALKEMARGMVESRVAHAVEAVLGNEEESKKIIEQHVDNLIAGLIEDEIRRQISHLRIGLGITADIQCAGEGGTHACKQGCTCSGAKA